MKDKIQVLNVQQMQHLQELGLKLKETLLYWARCVDNNPCAATHYEEWALIKGNNTPPTVGFTSWQFIPAYTLQDVMDALPEYIYDSTELYLLEINMFFKHIRYSRFNDVLTKRNFDRTPIIDAAYELLCWAIENKFVETNKNE